MNQKNIFTVIGAALLFQGIYFYAMGDKMISDVFPYLEYNGHDAAIKLLQVLSTISILVGLISFSVKNSPQVLWAYTLGFGLVSVLSLKHMLRDHVNVPVFAIIIQLVITLTCAYLWMKGRKAAA